MLTHPNHVQPNSLSEPRPLKQVPQRLTRTQRLTSMRVWVDVTKRVKTKFHGKCNQPGAARIPKNQAKMAEGVGFEPTVRFRTLVFKTSSFGRSDSPPMRPQAGNTNDLSTMPGALS